MDPAIATYQPLKTIIMFTSDGGCDGGMDSRKNSPCSLVNRRSNNLILIFLNTRRIIKLGSYWHPLHKQDHEAELGG